MTHTGRAVEWRVGKDKVMSSCGPIVVPLTQLFKSLESNSISQAQYLCVSLALTFKRHSSNVKGDAHTLESCSMYSPWIRIGLTPGFV